MFQYNSDDDRGNSDDDRGGSAGGDEEEVSDKEEGDQERKVVGEDGISGTSEEVEELVIVESAGHLVSSLPSNKQEEGKLPTLPPSTAAYVEAYYMYMY